MLFIDVTSNVHKRNHNHKQKPVSQWPKSKTKGIKAC